MRRLLRAAPFVLFAAALVSLVLPRRAQTVPLYAARTGLMCQSCHFDPNGGGPRNEFGFNYAKNRHALEPETGEKPWGELNLTNRVAENFPLYFSVNQRFMLLANTTVKSDSLDRFGFFSMENALHMAFQPHSKLTLVYTRDGFDAGSSSKEAFGMITLPGGGYLKAGRIRTPFGLRMDDHTVATRNSFLDFSGDPFNPPRFLPYNSRTPDMGLEYGMDHGMWFARAAFTNGESWPLNVGFGSPFAQAKTLKLGVNMPSYQGSVSVYDDFRNQVSFTDPLGRQRVTRWGYYGLTHWKQFAALGEIAAGTDQAFDGGKTNLLAAFGELNYAASRSCNFRARLDRVELDRNSDSAVREANTHNRYSIEGEWVPVPFAELRWTYRRIDHKDDAVKDENQAYLQFHFTY